ncbi:MAG: helix-turn-helix domain-containing protein, partial [Clostridium sp.]
MKEIAERVGKDPTTISKEIKRNRFLKVSRL